MENHSRYWLGACCCQRYRSLATGILPGKVVALEGDPLDNYRILVDVPELDTTGTGIWSHLASFYATAGKGAMFVPEIGDKVILGF